MANDSVKLAIDCRLGRPLPSTNYLFKINRIYTTENFLLKLNFEYMNIKDESSGSPSYGGSKVSYLFILTCAPYDLKITAIRMP